MYRKGKKISNTTYELIQQVEDEYNIELSSVQKILSSLGPIGVPLSALYGPLRLFVLKQHIKPADKEEAEKVEINEGEEIVYRESIVFKEGRPLFYGLTLIPTQRVKSEILEQLLNEKITIDGILSTNNIEIIREVIDLSVINATPLLSELFNTNDEMLKREYTITQHGTVRLYAEEIYPLSFFR